MEKEISIDSENLKIVIDRKNDDLSKTKIIIFYFLGLILIVALFMILGEILIIGVFLILIIFKPSQFTEIHFNTHTKTIIAAYSFYRRILKKRKILEDFSICSYSIVQETITSYEEDYEVFTLRATEYYYHYNLYHFKELKDAELVIGWLIKHLAISPKVD